MSDKHVALVVGSSGIIGSALVDTLFSAPEWSVRALRKTNLPGVEAIDCDLSDAKATRLALEAASDTTHVFYAALQTDPELARESEINTVMLRNVLDGLKANGAPLQRVVHYQGAKVYGVHLGASCVFAQCTTSYRKRASLSTRPFGATLQRQYGKGSEGRS